MSLLSCCLQLQLIQLPGSSPSHTERTYPAICLRMLIHSPVFLPITVSLLSTFSTCFRVCMSKNFLGHTQESRQLRAVGVLHHCWGCQMQLEHALYKTLGVINAFSF